MKVIATTQYRRLDYTTQMLKHLEQCYGIGEYTLVVGLEPHHPEVEEALQRVDFMDVQIHKNEHLLGCNSNTFATFERAFATAEQVILVEDDVLVAPDFLTWMEFGIDKCKHEPSDLIAATAWRRRTAIEPGQEMQYNRVDWAHVWGCGITRERWEDIKTFWVHSRDVRPLVSWDSNIIWHYQAKGMKWLTPLLGRTTNIGAQCGTYQQDPTWNALYEQTPLWSGDFDLTGRTDYVEVPTEAFPSWDGRVES